ncbi:MAG: hypothetical protein WD382_11125, partial [Halofilum sp. (in: g-proteobacteria)]
MGYRTSAAAELYIVYRCALDRFAENGFEVGSNGGAKPPALGIGELNASPGAGIEPRDRGAQCRKAIGHRVSGRYHVEQRIALFVQPFPFVARLQISFDDDAGCMCERLEPGDIFRPGFARSNRINLQAAGHLAARCGDRIGPAGADTALIGAIGQIL